MPASPVKQFPVEQNFPTEVNGKKLENYTDWIAGSFLITLMSLPGGSVPAGKTADGLPVGMQIVGPRFTEPKNPVARQADPARCIRSAGRLWYKRQVTSDQATRLLGLPALKLLMWSMT